MNNGAHSNTIRLSADVLRQLREMFDAQPTNLPESHPGELKLVVQGIAERFLIKEGFLLVLGRTSQSMNEQPGYDLSPFQAKNLGVSRWHALLHVEDNALYITDLGSTNGTYLSRHQLRPNVATKINKGEEILLGRLRITPLFRMM